MDSQAYKGEYIKNTADKVMVTVVVPVYNHALFVYRCLDSIFAIREPPLEIIVINDQSPDNSDEVIKEWIKAHPNANIRYIYHERNIGLPKSLNEAIRLSHGEYFCHISGDDIMLPNGIIDRIKYLQSHSDKLAVFSDCHVIDQRDSLLYESVIEDLHPRIGMRKRYLAIDHLIPFSVVFNFTVAGAAFMCRKILFDQIGLYDEELLIEDWDLYIRAATTGVLGFCDTYVANFRLHDKNMHKLFFSQPVYYQTIKRILEKYIPITYGLIHLRLIARKLLIDANSEPSAVRRLCRKIPAKAFSATTKLVNGMFCTLIYEKHFLSQWLIKRK